MVPEKYNAVGKGIPYITGASNIEDGKVIINRWTEFPKAFAYKGNILLTCKGTVGTMAILNESEVHIARQIMAIKPSPQICTEYIQIVLSSLVTQLKASAKSMIPGIGRDDVLKALLPLPPQSEQNRIVLKVAELDEPLAEYEQRYNSIQVLNNGFAEQLKKSILQLAVQGKLVPQDPNDEPASVLLERIHAEKERLIKEGIIKRDKNESAIYRRDNSHYEKRGNIERCIDDDIPFVIPDSWSWTRLGEIFQHNTGKALNGSNQSGELLEYITTSNLYWNRFELVKLRSMFFTEAEIDKCTAKKGDLLVCEGGDIGRAAIWPFDYDVRIQNHIHRLRPYTEMCIQYFYYLFYFYKNSGLIGGKGIGIQGLSSNALHQILFPIPPINEQYKIVQAIEQLFPYCDKL